MTHRISARWQYAYMAVAALLFAIEFLCSRAFGCRLDGYSGYIAFYGFILLAAFSWNSFLNPFVFLLPVLVYYIPNISELASTYSNYTYSVGWLLFLSATALWCGFQITGHHPHDKILAARPRPTIAQLSILAVAMLAVILADSLLLSTGTLVAKGLAFLTKDVAGLLLYAALLGLATKSATAFHLLYVAYLVVTIVSNSHADDVSRLSIVRAASLYILALAVMWRAVLKPITPLVVSACVVATTVLLLVEVEAPAAGGDALILSNVRDTVEKVERQGWDAVQPSMFVYNAGGYLIPKSLWLIGEKPQAYNASAWYLENVMMTDAAAYGWGVGLGGVGAAYLYGRYVAVAVLYMIVGLFLGYVMTRVRDAFSFGVYAHFLLLLPFAMYRMDETFLFGVAVVVVPCSVVVLRRPRSASKSCANRYECAAH